MMDMKKRSIILFFIAAVGVGTLEAKDYALQSPDGRLRMQICTDGELTYSVSYDGELLVERGGLAMDLDQGNWGGAVPKVTRARRESVDRFVASPFYRAERMADVHNRLLLDFRGGWSVEFRAYDDGCAYRFIGQRPDSLLVKDETVALTFSEDVVMTVPYVLVEDKPESSVEEQLMSSFENLYTVEPLSEARDRHLMMLPLVATFPSGVKLCVIESDLVSYPGLYLCKSPQERTLEGYFARYPKSTVQGGHHQIESLVTAREDFIARVAGRRSFPWRGFVIGQDVTLARSNLSYLLASESKIGDLSWIRPGKVAWEWWNDMNLEGVDFVTGVNDATYRYYVDFAAAHGIEYVILDEGWSDTAKADLLQVVPELDLPSLVAYAGSKGVGIILWAGYYAFDRNLEQVCRHYSEMGVKGFKVDFMDRDDQQMVDFIHRAAATAAKYHLLLDFHGMYKPAGLTRTWPNVVNVEGVFGLEQLKFRDPVPDMMTYDTTLPFVRQVSGPMDYTQGAMVNRTRESAYKSFSEPASVGTRAHQLALYVVFDSPLNMLCDSPTNYMREAESLASIASIPTVWDETVVLDGRMGDYIVTARRSGSVWYVGGITDWNARDLQVNLDFLPEGSHQAELFVDGVNAHRKATDYRTQRLAVSKHAELPIHLAPGGGFLIRIVTE